MTRLVVPYLAIPVLLLGQMEGTGVRGGPTVVSVGVEQTFTATLPAPVDGGFYVQFYLRVASSNPYQGDHTCNAIANPTINAFFMEDDGTFGQTPPWIQAPAAIGGSSETRFNSQCTLYAEKSRAYHNPDRSSTLSINVRFKNPLVPHSTQPCPANCDNYAPGEPWSVGERYWWVLGYTNLGSWDGWHVVGPVIPNAIGSDRISVAPSWTQVGNSQLFSVRMPGRYVPTPYISWSTVLFRITQPHSAGHQNQGVLPSLARPQFACTVKWSPGQLSLEKDDPAQGIVGQIPIGSGLLENSQCKLNGALSGVILDGSGGLNLLLNIEFKPAFAPGGQERWMWVRGESSAGASDWTAIGWVKPQAGGGPDTTPPVISQVDPVPGSTTAFVNWTTNEMANTQVNYGIPSPSPGTVFDGTVTTSHSPLLSGLQPGTTYIYEVLSADPTGNQAVSTGTFATSQASLSASAQSAITSGPCRENAAFLQVLSRVERIANNRVRLIAQTWTSKNPNDLDWRNYYLPYVKARPRLNGVYLGPEVQIVATAWNQKAEVFWEFDLQQTGVGLFGIESTHWGASSYCNATYPGQFVSIFHSRSDQTTILRPARPDYSSTGGPVFFLGTGVSVDGQYASFTPLVPGNPNGAAGLPEWIVVAGSQYGTLSCTNCGLTVFTATKKGSGCEMYDVVIKTRYGGLESDPFYMFINAPNEFVQALDPAYLSVGIQVLGEVTDPLGDGYESRISYAVKGLCPSDPLLQGVSANESFGTWTNDYASANWNHGPVGYWSSQNVITDTINFNTSMQNACSSFPCIPTPLQPPFTSGGYIAPIDPVHHVPQTWRIGSTQEGLGAVVQTNTLRRYRNKAQHDDRVTPVQ